MAPIEIIAVIKPKAGKIDRVQELLLQTAEHVKANEPGTLSYSLKRETGVGEAPSLVMIESYKDKAALGIHGGSAAFKALGRALKAEELLASPMQLIFAEGVGGFASRL